MKNKRKGDFLKTIAEMSAGYIIINFLNYII